MAKDSLTKPATIYDVAALAGVSHITVSRVVNGKSNVKEETRQRVRAAMEELSYFPNHVAQTLQTRRSRVIELVTADIWGIRTEGLAAAIYHARDSNYQVSILPTLPGDLEELYGILATIPNRMVAGTLLYAQHTNLDYQRVARLVKNHPLVHIGGRLNSSLPSVTYDQYYLAQLAVQHLIDLGHRHIAFLGGQMGILDGYLRYEAWGNLLKQKGLPIGPSAFGNFAVETGAEAMQSILQSGAPFTAVFASTDSMAIGALHTLDAAGLRVPEDVSVVGYDNDRLVAYIHPSLTTIVNDFDQLGRTALAYLMELIQNPDTAHHQRILQSSLIVRESTCPPRSLSY